MFYSLQYTNELGDSIRFGGDNHKVIELEGFGEVVADIQRQRVPYQDGSTFVDSVLLERPLFINFVIAEDDYKELAVERRHIGKVFNPKLSGLLSLKHGDGEYQIRCYPEHVPMFPDDGTDAVGRVQTVGINLIAPDPYWRTPSIIEDPAFEPLFSFPFEGEFLMGMQRNDRQIYNDGDSSAPLLIDFYGPADSPYIENITTGEFIRINKRLEEGQTLKIDTSDGIKSVTYVDEDGTETNVFNWIDLDSTFFSLSIGENDITCRCAVSNNQKDFDIYYQKLYNAI